jgi:transposase InsO family protein
VHAMERNLKKLQIENDIFIKSGCGVNSTVKEKISAVERLKNDYSVHAICRTLHLLKSTYYHHILHAPIKKWFEERNEMLRPRILNIFQLSGERFGAKKIVVQLKREGIAISPRQVSKLMKEMDLICKQNRLRMFNTTNRDARLRKNRLRQNFNQTKPNVFWVSDTSYILVDNNDYYICVVIELFSRKVLSFGVSHKNNADLTLETLRQAFELRCKPTGLTFHADQGSPYTAYKIRKYARDNGIKQSFSNPGTPYDNAVAEGFFSMMKRESLSHKWYKSKEELDTDVTEYVSFFNELRTMRRLGNKTPNEFEKDYFEDLSNPDKTANLDLST